MTDLGLIVGLETMEGHDEAGDASRIVDRLYPHYPGVLGSIADGAYRGKHRRHHYQHGKQLICPQNSAPRDSEGAEAAPKLSFIEGVEITLSATGQPHRLEIYSKGGQVGVGTMAVNGELVFTPARIIDVESKRNKDGGWRWYAKFRLPSGGPYQAETFTLRIDGEDRPERERVNPAEAVHIVAKDDPLYELIRGRRQPAESVNSQFKARMAYHRRSHTYSRRRQRFDALAFAVLFNSMALWQHRQWQLRQLEQGVQLAA